MPKIPFIKACAAGNDFLMVRLSEVDAGSDLAELTRRMCDRHDGVGADGIEFLMPESGVDMRARLINADGSNAEVSGNGTRCVASLVAAETGKTEIQVMTDAGVKECKLITRDGNSFEFEADMGEPAISQAFAIKASFGEITGIPVSMGNPHFSIFVRKFATGWQSEGAELSTRGEFPEGTNVEFIHVRDESNIAVRFFERGAGETKSSGTGSCAAAVASIHAGKVKSPVTIHTQGGIQTVRWDKRVFLRGPAHIVCQGEFFI